MIYGYARVYTRGKVADGNSLTAQRQALGEAGATSRRRSPGRPRIVLSSRSTKIFPCFGQESNQTTWRLAKVNLAIRAIDSDQMYWNSEGSSLNDALKDVRADFIPANPPFNDSDWSGEMLRDDARWKYTVPPTGNANFAWLQYFAFHLSLTGYAGIVLAKGV